jgi:hypothetical protein
LVEQLELVAEHFRKGAASPRITLVSGYRPQSRGSTHATGSALDFRVEGVPNDSLVAFCKTLPDTGCGYYPNSIFVHMDVRPGRGAASWVDASHPGEDPRCVSAWPPAPGDPAETGQAGDTRPQAQRDDALPPLPLGGDAWNLEETGRPRRDRHPYFF